MSIQSTNQGDLTKMEWDVLESSELIIINMYVFRFIVWPPNSTYCILVNNC